MNLFVYGTLLAPQIWEAVTGNTDTIMIPADLFGYRIRCVVDADFPAITREASEDNAVPGRVALAVSDEALRRLDAYEDSFYERVPVTVETEGRALEAETYVITPTVASSILSERPWTFEWFEKNAFDRYWGHHFAS